MDCKSINLLTLIIPGLVTILGNIVFYIIVKSKIDRSIERHKISYSGIFKEKLEIHKSLLKQIFDLKLKIQRYQYSGQKELGVEIFHDFNSFINYYQMNQPFLKKGILEGLKTLTKELQECFDDFYMHNSLSSTPGLDSKIRTETLNKFFESGNKFKKNEPFQQIEDLLITEMKIDLKILD